MIKTTTEFNEAKNMFVKFKYDTKNIKTHCVMCHKEQTGDLEGNYIKRGNFCATCNARY